MDKFMQIMAVVMGGMSVAVADALIKKVTDTETTMLTALKHPLMILIVILYYAQIVLFTYVFIKRWNLGIVGLMQMAVYAAIVVGSGFLIFHEKLTPTQGVGMALALTGVFLMNS